MVALPADSESAPIPSSAVVAAPEPAPAAPESRSVTVAGLGEFAVPNSLPVLTGIPGVTDSAATPAAPAMVTPKQNTGERAVEAAKSKLGSYYRAGGNGPDSFDCSGLVQWSYAQAGVDLPRTSYSQLNSGTPVGLDELQPGDLVSFYGGGHSAIYAGDGKVIHASTYGTGVIESDMGNMPVTGARRF
ncbi:C40 family peptidase [Nocardia sp. 2]|uniref:C40 family peptidase n=2 Tax=Nocardia acididurans TaxID=2802282 RepID=A0ABS1M8C4_9NOCA|nr:C40 family peptidase [Nocardia acididurans]